MKCDDLHRVPQPRAVQGQLLPVYTHFDNKAGRIGAEGIDLLFKLDRDTPP
jgi:hypothetical protein